MCIFKSFVLAFEQKTPQIHKLLDAIIASICTFLCFLYEHEKVNQLSPKQFRVFKAEGTVRKAQSILVGGSNHDVIPELKRIKLAYITATKYLLSKFLTNSKLLMSFSAIDPREFSVGQPKKQRLLTKLEFFFPTFVTVEKKQTYLEDVNSILVDKTLLKAIAGDGNVGLDKCWSIIFNTG